MKICEKCGRPVSYNSYFKAYFCTECGGYYTKSTEHVNKTITVKRADKTILQTEQKVACQC